MTQLLKTDPEKLAIDPARAALLVVDVQERLAAAMPEQALARVERNLGILAELARRFEIPVVVSEQYPRGLGRTRAPVEEVLAPLGAQVRRLEKIEFSVCAAGEFAPVWESLGREQWIVTGMECHVCVYQSVRQLLARGARVQVARDAVISRTKENWKAGLSLMERAGAVISSTEVVVFDALQRAGSDDFKALSKLIR